MRGKEFGIAHAIHRPVKTIMVGYMLHFIEQYFHIHVFKCQYFIYKVPIPAMLLNSANYQALYEVKNVFWKRPCTLKESLYTLRYGASAGLHSFVLHNRFLVLTSDDELLQERASVKNSVRSITIPITLIFMGISSSGYPNMLGYHHGIDASSFVEQEAPVNLECLNPR